MTRALLVSEAKMKPWMYLLEELSFHPTIPLVIAALQAAELLQETDDGYDDGLALFHDIVGASALDEKRLSVSLELCPRLGVPVMHLRDRSISIYSRSMFPSSGKSRGRLCVQHLVEKTRFQDLDALYSSLFDNRHFEHAFAIQERHMSRDYYGQRWVDHEDTDEFDEAARVLTESDRGFEAIGE